MSASRQILRIVCVSLAILIYVFVLNSNGDMDTEGRNTGTNGEFTTVIPLNHNTLTIYDAKKNKEVSLPIVLRRTGRFTHPMRYQLRSDDGSTGYVHVVSLQSGGVGWKLFNQGPGTNYLAWISESSVGIKEVSKMRDSIAEEPIILRLIQFLPRDNLESRESAIHTDTEILHVGKDMDGFLRVKVRDPINDRIFNFTFDGKSWRGYDSNGVEIPSKWK